MSETKKLRGPRNEDPERKRARERAYYHANPQKRIKSQRFRKFGLTEAKYNAALEKQAFKCALCTSPQPGGVGDWHIDHCHKTGRVRGLLCKNCNLGLGLFKDNPDLLEAGAVYLKQDTDLRK